jgi:hypothetical protein
VKKNAKNVDGKSPRCRVEDIIKSDLGEIGYGNVN